PTVESQLQKQDENRQAASEGPAEPATFRHVPATGFFFSFPASTDHQKNPRAAPDMSIPDFTYRTSEEEIMDDFYLQGEELRRTLEDLDRVNKWLGGNRITLEGIRKLLPTRSSGRIRIVDVGCGNGTLLREIAAFGRK